LQQGLQVEEAHQLPQLPQLPPPEAPLVPHQPLGVVGERRDLPDSQQPNLPLLGVVAWIMPPGKLRGKRNRVQTGTRQMPQISIGCTSFGDRVLEIKVLQRELPQL